jgi:hypothetical protein
MHYLMACSKFGFYMHTLNLDLVVNLYLNTKFPAVYLPSSFFIDSDYLKEDE